MNDLATVSEVPPQDLRAEDSLIGSLLVIDVLSAVLAETHLAPEHFQRDRHRHVFRAMLALADRGDPVDEITVVDELRRRGHLEEIGGENRLAELAATVAAPGNALHHARLIVEKAQWRRRLDAGRAIRDAALAEDLEQLARGEALLAEEIVHPDVLYDADRQRDILYDLQEGKAAAEFFWPLEKLNRLQSGGMRRGQLVIVSGYTNEGKSHFADQILDTNRKHGRVCLYDNEMEPAERVGRRATRLAGVHNGRLMDGALHPHENQKLLGFLNSDLHWPIVDMAGWSPQEVCHHIRQQRWDLAVVDILHNFPFSDERELASSVALFKATAKLARCVIVLVAHVNRGGVERGKRRRPVRSDLRWSGDLENLADAVCFVYREQDFETNEALSDGHVYFDKCRGGKLGAQEVTFNDLRLRFEVRT